MLFKLSFKVLFKLYFKVLFLKAVVQAVNEGFDKFVIQTDIQAVV